MPKRPIILMFDVEPDGLRPGQEPDTWRGFEALVEIMQDFRDRVRAATARPAHFNWFVRMDPQIEATYGRADWAYRRFERLFQRLESEGDEIGLHTHTWRWDGARRHWFAEFADKSWIEHCVRLSFETYRACFGRGCQSFRFGGSWIGNEGVALLERLGARRELSIEPGQPARPAGEFDRGQLPDLRRTPRRPYQPARNQFDRPGRRLNRRSIWMIPMSTVDANALLGPVRSDPIEPVRPEARLEGFLDVAERPEIFGWAYDASRPDEPIGVELFLDDRPWTTLWAKDRRDDLIAAGKGNGRHGFRVSLPAAVCDDRPHVLRVHFAGRAQQLAGSPRNVLWPSNAPPNVHALDLCLPESYMRPWIGHLLASESPYFALAGRTAVGVAENRDDCLDATLRLLLDLPEIETFSFDASADALLRLVP